MTNDSAPESDSRPNEIEASYTEFSAVIDGEILNTVSERFSHLSPPLRIKLLYTVNRSKVSLADILDQYDISKDEIEAHLDELIRQSLVEMSRDGDQKIYATTIEGSKMNDAIIDQLEVELSAEHELARYGDSPGKLREANIETKHGDKNEDNFD